MELHPENGTRYLLELESADGTSQARYRGVVYTPSEAFEYTIDVDSAGETELRPTEQAASAEHESRLASFAKVLGRGAGKKASEGLEPWPRRLLRWRK